MSTRHSFEIPDFIEASSPRLLRFLMLQTNNEHQCRFTYFDIQSYVDKRGKLKWVAWFYREFTEKDFAEANK